MALAAPISAAEKQMPYEDFGSAKFDRPTVIDNTWLPLKPGNRWVWEGTTVDDEGKKEPHTVMFIVTDLTMLGSRFCRRRTRGNRNRLLCAGQRRQRLASGPVPGGVR
jgi:hypothetical protein